MNKSSFQLLLQIIASNWKFVLKVGTTQKDTRTDRCRVHFIF